MKKTINSLLASLALVSVSSAANIKGTNISSDFTTIRPVTTAAGEVIANGAGVVGLGFFTVSEADVIAAFSGSDVAAKDSVLAAFTSFGSTTTFGGAGGFNTAGLYGSDFSQPLIAPNDLIGKNIYTLVGNGASFTGSTELLLIKHEATFPEDNPTGVADALAYTGASYLFGAEGAAVALPGLAGEYPSLRTAPVPVPEPGIAALMALSTVAALRRKRK